MRLEMRRMASSILDRFILDRFLAFLRGILAGALPDARSVDDKLDERLGGFGLMCHELGAFGIAPARKIYDARRLRRVVRRPAVRLHDVQAVIVEKERVITVAVVERRNQLMIFRNRLALILCQRVPGPVQT